MRVGKTTIYGLFAVVYVARQRREKPVKGREIADAYGIPVEYLLKILQTLAQGGVLHSARGRSGGFILNRSPKDINLGEIQAILEPPPAMVQLLDEAVQDQQPVKSYLRTIYSQAFAKMEQSLGTVSVQDILDIQIEAEHSRRR